MHSQPRIVHYPPPDGSGDLGELHPLLRRVFLHRGVHSRQELDLDLNHLLPADTLLHGEKAATLLADYLTTEKRLLIVADFDADGATSCALAIKALRLMGARYVNYLVPNRFEYGYGLTPDIVAEAHLLAPDLIITVDNGISSCDGVAAAKEAGIEVLVTDHHLPGEQLPEAAAIVNPNQVGDKFPSKNLAGVGVIFYLMALLRSRLHALGWFDREGLPLPNLASLLDLVALGTVADVVPLDYNNRILVQQGLRRMRAGHCCAGIKALSEVAGVSLSHLIATDLGYRIGPRLNAAGRLDDMSLGIECLLTDDMDTARRYATLLDGLNRERREIEQSMRDEALSDLEILLSGLEDPPFGITLYRESWHQGVIGILAARVREYCHRPVIAFAPGDEGELKGSARSIKGLHIRDALASIANSHAQLLKKFGGHAMAAGLTIATQDFERFSVLFNAEIMRMLDGQVPEDLLYSDGALTQEECSLEIVEQLLQITPWGQHFPEPRFNGVFDVVDFRVLGEKHVKFQLRMTDSNQLLDAIAFNQVDRYDPSQSKIHVLYQLGINRYKGEERLQVIIDHIES